jgi:hypothetical protein
LTVPFKTALVAVIEEAAKVVTIGGGGDATIASECKAVDPLQPRVKNSPDSKADEFTTNGWLLDPGMPEPNSPSPL